MTKDEAQAKRFFAPTMTRALELVRDEMGPEAVILSSKKVKGGVEILISAEPDFSTRGVPERRAFGRNFDTELDQAMDSDMSWQSQAGIEKAAADYSAHVEDNSLASSVKEDGLAEAIERAREKMFAAKRQSLKDEPQPEKANTAPESPKASEENIEQNSKEQGLAADLAKAELEKTQVENERKLESLRGEIADLRMLLEEQVWTKKQVPSVVNFATTTASDNHQSALATHLSRLGITQALVRELCSDIDSKARISEAWQSSLTKLSQKISVSDNINVESGGTFAFVGPTGVGKTTTLAKLAARYTLANGPGKVALVSMDTHRVGAVEQLRALGRILDVPVRTVSGSNSLMTTLASLRHFPLVLIDTAGFRSGDVNLRRQLAQLDENPDVKRLLVLSSLSQLQTLKASIHAYQPRPGVDACVISKLDEATSLGESISAIIEHALPVAYVTDGQDIPKDLHQADSYTLVSSAVSIAKQSAVEESVL